jgi:hypothetical protein
MEIAVEQKQNEKISNTDLLVAEVRERLGCPSQMLQGRRRTCNCMRAWNGLAAICATPHASQFDPLDGIPPSRLLQALVAAPSLFRI